MAESNIFRNPYNQHVFSLPIISADINNGYVYGNNFDLRRDSSLVMRKDAEVYKIGTLDVLPMQSPQLAFGKTLDIDKSSQSILDQHLNSGLSFQSDQMIQNLIIRRQKKSMTYLKKSRGSEKLTSTKVHTEMELSQEPFRAEDKDPSSQLNQYSSH